MRAIPFFLAAASLVGCEAATQTPTPDAGDRADAAMAVPTLDKLWTTTGFAAPESVIPDGDGGYFVSLVDGEGSGKDAKGGIARIGANGTVIEPDWVTGIDAPKGLAWMGDGQTLVVTNIDELVMIDPGTPSVTARLPIEGATFLNDVAAFGDGLLVTDSATATIHYVEGDTARVWAQGDAFAGVNGLFVRDDDVLVTTMSAGTLLSVSPDGASVTELATGMENADGIAPFAGGYLVSSWPGQLWFTGADGSVSELSNTVDAPINMNDFYLDGDTLIVANWRPGSVTAWRVVP